MLVSILLGAGITLRHSTLSINCQPAECRLESFDLLQQHIRGQLEQSNTTEKGKRFARFAQRLIPQTEIGAGFGMPDLNEKLSNDGGIDLTAKDQKTGRTLYIQSKLYVDRADTIDSILSKFQAFTSNKKREHPTFDEIVNWQAAH
jgi:hypothetical protein